MKIMKISGIVNKYMLFIGILLILNVRVFYLVNVDALPVAYTDVALLVALLFEFYVMIKLWPQKVYYKYKWFVLAIIPLMLSSSIMGTITYNQPFSMGVLPQRGWVIWMLGYFPLVKLLKEKKIKVDKLLAMMYKIAIVYLSIVTIQYIFPQFSFLYVNKNIRYDEIRLYVGDSPIILLAGHALNQVFKKHSLKHAAFFVWCVILESVIMKGRAGTVTMLIAALVCVFIEKGNINKKVFRLAVIGIVIAIFLQTDMGHQLIGVLRGQAGMETDYVRQVGRALYLELLSQNWLTTLFGCGYANANWERAVFFIMGSGRYYSEGLTILTADNGMYGFALYYGLIGIIWVIAMYVYCLIRAWRVYRRSGNFMFIFFLVWDFIGFQTLYLDCTYALLEFPIFLAMLEITEINTISNQNDEAIEQVHSIRTTT